MAGSKISKMEFQKKLKEHKVILYGKRRYVRDFIYVYTGIFGDFFKRYYYSEIVKEVTDIPVHNSDLLILCDVPDEQNLMQKSDCQTVWMEELFEYLDELNVGYYDKKNPSDNHCRVPDRKIVLWGVNGACSFFIAHQPNLEISYVMDMDASQKENDVMGVPIVDPTQIGDWKEYFVIIMENDAKYKVRDLLMEKGLQETVDFTYYGFYGPWGLTASQMMKKTIFAQSLDVACKEAFEFAFTEKNGELWMCCYAPGVAFGNILHEGFERVWHGVFAALLRLSMINRTYSFCNPYTCIYNLSQNNVLKEDIDNGDYFYTAGAGPKRISVSHSNTCNLWCESCRNELFVEKGKDAKRAVTISGIVVKDILPGTESIIIAGNGEVFASTAYTYILDYAAEHKVTGKSWNIFSNGKLLTKENLNRVLEVGKGNINLVVSVDAATKETYEKLRRGGNWELLMQNLTYAGELCKKGKIQNMTLDFVVQKKNIAEMASFVRLAKKLGANHIDFTGIANWGTYSSEQFEEISILDGNGKCKQEYRSYFQDPVLYTKGVRLGNIHLDE